MGVDFVFDLGCEPLWVNEVYMCGPQTANRACLFVCLFDVYIATKRDGRFECQIAYL